MNGKGGHPPENILEAKEAMKRKGEAAMAKGTASKKVRSHREVGEEMEQKAAMFLESQGYRIVERNFYARAGEIDIIARENGVLVFVEVKSCHPENGIFPEEVVDRRKRERIVKTARYYLARRKLPEDVPCRFDVVAISGSQVHLLRDAFWEVE